MVENACTGFSPVRRWTRRRLLMAGSLGLFGLGLPDLLRATTANERRGSGRARSCILVFAWGGPSQLDTLDPKPEAPAEVRGEFDTIATRVPGLRFSEHFPRLANLADRYAVVRSLTHDDPAHLSSVHHLTTGRHAPKVKSDADGPSRRDTPHLGSVLAHLRPRRDGLPPFVTLPWIVSHPAAPGGIAPGQNAGWLGTQYDPFVLTGDPNAAGFAPPGISSALEPERLQARRRLLNDLPGTVPGAVDFHARAFDLLTSRSAQEAFRLDREPAGIRERYGRNIHGQAMLLARRLVEAGVRLVCVNWHQDGRNFWDTHGDNFNRLKRDLMPPTDQGLSALLEDLEQRGLLEETVVAWVGEFGRRPQISAGNAGREHWPFCYSGILAGGGIRGGQVLGRSDRQAAYPLDRPVSPADFTATLYQALGVPSDTLLRDRENRPIPLTEGRPLEELF